jgi:hypothetical protein
MVAPVATYAQPSGVVYPKWLVVPTSVAARQTFLALPITGVPASPDFMGQLAAQDPVESGLLSPWT